ncbi:MAG: tRNA pseudouridine(55) synthase TruB [Patescibacteria group bacterium]|jgi:tRNA pseudouridine55 synthase
MNNLFAVYKPKGPSSNQMLNKIRKLSGTRKVGHAGTLDPLASGVLVVGIGREATKKLRYIMEEEKEYIGTVKLGETSETDDEEGIKSKVESHKVESHKIKKVIEKFQGKIMQVPPVYSAVKVKGKEAYKRARKGENVEMAPREVEIKEIEILEYKWPYLKIKVVCGSGTYIRSLARDIGERLGVGGYLADLERIRVGDFNKKDAVCEDGLAEFLEMTK